jgi:hypothetical protein
MAYGLHPQLYPYLYAPKNPLSLQPTYDHLEALSETRTNSKEKAEAEEYMTHDDVKGDDDCPIEENENVEID